MANHERENEEGLTDDILKLFDIPREEIKALPGHEGGRNRIYLCSKGILRVARQNDRTFEDYLAETEFVHYLAVNGAPVVDIQNSVNKNLVEQIETEQEGRKQFISLFDDAKGMLIAENGYKYRENAPLSEYFYNTGKALGKIHRLSKVYTPVHKRIDYFEKYNMDYMDKLISDKYSNLKRAISKHLDSFRGLPKDSGAYGLVHFDFSDGNYHVDMETGDITVFDFDNCMYCWYLFDLANLWVHGFGWCMSESDAMRRKEIMADYFDTILKGYRSETDVSEELLEKLPLFINMVLIENIVDEFECCKRDNEEVEYEEIEEAAECLINEIPYAGFFTE